VGWHVADSETTLQTATISVSNSGAGSFSVVAAENANWLTVSQSGSSTPLQLTLTADPAALESGQSIHTNLQVTGTSGSGTEIVIVPVSFSKGEVTFGSTFRVFLPVILKP
jgi:hypothetical protein